MLKILDQVIRQANKLKQSNEKGRSQIVSACRWCESPKENPKDVTKMLLELVNEFNKISETKVSIQIS